MSGPTRILVIPLKKLIITICIIAAFIIIATIYILSVKEPDNSPASTTSRQNKASTATYSPGVYTSSLMLNGTPVDIQVTVDSDNINNIELVNLSESVQTMYPMLTSSFGDIKKAVMESGSTANITYDSATSTPPACCLALYRVLLIKLPPINKKAYVLITLV